MNRTLLVLVSLSLSAVLLHCGGERHAADSPSSVPTIAPAELPPAASSSSDAGSPVPPASAAQSNAANVGAANHPKSAALTDKQIAGITGLINDDEREEGKLAQLKSKDPAVQHFAAQMIAAHEERKTHQDKLNLPTADSQLGNEFGTAAARAFGTLKTAEGTAFDKAYMDAQVIEHQNLLDALNDRMIPSAQNPDLKAYLNQFAPHVAAHLKEAKEIQSALARKVAPATTQ